jgi:hypothetical protein
MAILFGEAFSFTTYDAGATGVFSGDSTSQGGKAEVIGLADY